MVLLEQNMKMKGGGGGGGNKLNQWEIHQKCLNWGVVKICFHEIFMTSKKIFFISTSKAY